MRQCVRLSNLFLQKGAAQEDFDALFGDLDADPPGAVDGLHDSANMPLEEEPKRVRDDLDTVQSR